jgi:hypothetical protein
MYTSSLPLYYELVIDSEDGADGDVDSGAPLRCLAAAAAAALVVCSGSCSSSSGSGGGGGGATRCAVLACRRAGLAGACLPALADCLSFRHLQRATPWTLAAWSPS